MSMLTGEYIQYQTLQGDTWDLIAWKMYGSATMIQEIIFANPHVAIVPILPMNVILAIPIHSNLRPTLSDEQRPPWRAKGT
jgi:phage tail protein X